VHRPGMLPGLVHSVPSGWFMKFGLPAVQIEILQVTGGGRSASSFWLTLFPEPSHTRALQSPVTCCAGGKGMPDWVKLTPQLLPVQIRLRQNVSVPGQSPGALQNPADVHALVLKTQATVQESVPPVNPNVWQV